jgi:hypothetical protein
MQEQLCGGLRRRDLTANEREWTRMDANGWDALLVIGKENEKAYS